MRAVPQNVVSGGISRLLSAAFCCMAAFASLCLCPGGAWAAEKIEVTVLKVIKRDDFIGVLKEPAAIFFDESKQRLYVADSGNKRLVSFDEKFDYLSELGDERFGAPSVVVKTADGNFYILDAVDNALKFVNLQEKSVTAVVLKGAKAEREPFVPGRFAVDKAGNICVIDRLNGAVLVFDSAGNFVRAMSVQGDRAFKGFNYVHAGQDGSVYAVDSVGQRVYVFDAKGKVKTVLGKAAKGQEEALVFPSAVATDKDGFIYVADKHAGRILVYGKAGGRPVYYIGMRGLNDGQLQAPVDITVDSKKRVFVLDGIRLSVFLPAKASVSVKGR